MSPIIPEIYFDRVFPTLFIVVYIFYIFMVTLLPVEGKRVTSENTGRELCIWETPDIYHLIIFIVSTVFDLFMTVFLLYLYGKPIREIVKHSQTRHKDPKAKKTPAELKYERCIQVILL